MVTEADIETCIFRIFLEYHITPDAIIGLLSAELLMERILSFVATSTSRKVWKTGSSIKRTHSTCKERYGYWRRSGPYAKFQL